MIAFRNRFLHVGVGMALISPGLQGVIEEVLNPAGDWLRYA